MTQNNRQAVWTLIQTLVTAVLLAIQTIFFGGCVSAGGDVNQTNDVKITVPSFMDALNALKSDKDELTLTFEDFTAIDDELVQFRQELANQYYADTQ